MTDTASSSDRLTAARDRVDAFLYQYTKTSGLDQERIDQVHHQGGKAPAPLLVDDLAALLEHLAGCPARWEEAFAEPVVIELRHPGEDALGAGQWRASLWWTDQWNRKGEGFRDPDAQGSADRLGEALTEMTDDWNDNN